ncbi:uncharacterized protein [Ptychodera flava]|uniref:uncharacterized protein n=1 Tax=Ptychodera flava TaxID=63121 RepID=UPI003969C7B8
MERVARELEDAFGNEYPSLSIASLKTICDTKHGGDIRKMCRDYVDPTKRLIAKLKAKNIPLVQGNNVIVHLFDPEHTLGVGEFYFQISKSCPGELAMKFTKFVTEDDDGRPLPKSQWGYEIENALVEEDDFGRLFSLTYFDELRREGKLENRTKRTNANFRLYVVKDIKTGKADVMDSDDIFPETVNVMEGQSAKLMEQKLPEQVCDLTTLQIRALARKLDKISLGGDYQSLADKVGFTWDDIKDKFMNSRSPTQELIIALQERQPNYSIRVLLNDLKEINRMDAAIAMCEADEVKRSPRGSREDLTNSPVQESEETTRSSDTTSNGCQPVENEDAISSEALPIEESQKKKDSSSSPSEGSTHSDAHNAQPETPDCSHVVMVAGDKSFDLNATPTKEGQSDDTTSSKVENSAESRRDKYKKGGRSFENIQPDSISPRPEDMTSEPPKVDQHNSEGPMATSSKGTERKNGYIRGTHRSLDNKSTGTKADESIPHPTTKYVKRKKGY